MAKVEKSNPYPALIEALDALASRVELGRTAAIPAFPNTEDPPSGSALWSGTYANLILWPIVTADMTEINKSAVSSQNWMDALLSQFPHLAIDGYVVLALQSEPDTSLLSDIWKLETSTQVCRKHVIWPVGKPPRWKRLESVTVLGLPTGPITSGVSGWPTLPSRSNVLWQAIEASGYSAVVKQHESEADEQSSAPE